MAHKWDINNDLIQGDKLNLWLVTGNTEGGYDVLPMLLLALYR